MARIVCQVLHGSDRVTFLWSHDNAAFEPYHLSAAETARLNHLAGLAREHLSHGDHAGLAGTGHDLHRLVFRQGENDPVADAVKDWLDNQADVTLEILSDNPGRIPWNVVYGVETRGTPDPKNFWGVRYSLSVGRRVNPLRLNLVLSDASVLLALDPAGTHKDLAGNPKLASAEPVQSALALKNSLRTRCPDLLYIAGKVEGGELRLGDDRIALADLRTWIDDADEGNFEPLVFLDVTGPGDGWSDFVLRAALTFPGLITWEDPPAGDASAIGKEALTQILGGAGSVGKTLQDVRARHIPAALGLAAFCPADVQFGGEPEGSNALYPLPEAPYRPLQPYDREDRPLFGGRDRDLFRFVSLLDEPGARLVLLHGGPGIGKTSFLQAAVVPFLEDDAVGYFALRDRTPEEGETPAESDYPVLSLSAGADLAGQLAEGLAAFCAQPFTYTLPTGATKSVPLPDLLRQALKMPTSSTAFRDTLAGTPAAPPPVPAGDKPIEAVDVWAALNQDPSFLGPLLTQLTRDLPNDLLILVEDAEELITSRPEEKKPLETALKLLTAAGQAERCRVVVSVRTDYLGRLIQGFPRGAAWSVFHLPELNRDQLLEAALLPTSTSPPPYTDEVPGQKYQFDFKGNLAHDLVNQVEDGARASGVSAAALLQIVCSQALAQARRTRRNVIEPRDLRRIGGVKGALAKFVDERIRSLPLRRPSQRPIRQLLVKLHRKQPDGAITRASVPVADVVRNWSGADDVQGALESAENAGLLRVRQSLVHGQPLIEVAPGQDAIARLGNQWMDDRERSRVVRSKVIDTLWVTIPLICLAAAVAFYFTRRHFAGDLNKVAEQSKFVQNKLEAKVSSMLGPQYFGYIQRASDAWQTSDVLRMRKMLLTQQISERDQRQFEWYHLWYLANSERRRFDGHQAPVLAVTLSADGQVLATGSGEGKLYLWDLKTGSPLATLGHTGPVRALALSADGKTLASAGTDNIYLWDVPGNTTKADDKEKKGEKGEKDKKGGKDQPAPAFRHIEKPAATLTEHKGAVNALAFVDQTLVSAGADQSVLFWDLSNAAKPAVKHTLKDHKSPVLALAAPAKGKVIASAAADGKIIVWDAGSGKNLQTLETGKTKVNALAFTDDGALLASGSDGQDGAGSIRFWDPATGKPQKTAEAKYLADVFALAFSADGKTLFSGGKDHVVRLWDVAAGSELGQIKGHLGWVRSLAVSRDPENPGLVTGSQDAQVKYWHPRPSLSGEVLQADMGALTSVAVAPDNKLLAAAGKNGNIYLWDIQSNKPVDTLKGPKGSVTGVAFSRVSQKVRLAASYKASADEGEIKTWDIDHDDKGKPKIKELFSLAGKGKAADCLAFSSDGELVAFGGPDNIIHLWKPGKETKTEELKGHTKRIRCLAFGGGSAILASGSDDQTVRAWILGKDKGGDFPPFEGHSGPVLSVAFATDALLSAGADQTVRAWKLGKKTPLLSFRTHSGPITSLLLNKYIFTASADGTIKTCDPSGERFTLTGHTGPIRSIASTTDSLVLASAGDDGTVRLWRSLIPPNRVMLADPREREQPPPERESDDE